LCNKRERKLRKIGWCSAKNAALPTENGRALKDFINCKPVFVWKKQVFWVVAPYDWVFFPKLQRNLPPSSSAVTQPHGVTTQHICLLNNNAVGTSDHCVGTVENIFLSDYLILLIHCVF
jgi:hypothetical protein